MGDGSTPCGPFLTLSSNGGPESTSWFALGDEPTFLNGLNLAWIRYPDFTPAAADHADWLPSICQAEDAMRFLVQNGGNALRVWVLQEPGQSLVWRDGLVVGLGPGVLRMAQMMLEMALRYDVLVVFVLFNGALVQHCHPMPCHTNCGSLLALTNA